MAQPKKRTTNSRTGTRRSQIKLVAPALVYCEKCHEKKVKYQVCPNCGTYRGKQIIIGK